MINTKDKAVYLALILLIIIFVAINMLHIKRPLYSTVDSARQVHTAAITQDLHQNGFNIFNTKIYFGGDRIRYIEEFPVYNMIVASLYCIFGENIMLGRLISVLLFSLSLVFLFKIFELYFSSELSIAGVFIFAFSYFTLYYSDFFQQTSLDVFLTTLHIFLFLKFHHTKKRSYYWLWLIFGSLNILVRPILIFILVPMFIIIMIDHGFKALFKRDYILFCAITAFLVAAWYIFGYLTTGQAYPGFYHGYFSLDSFTDISQRYHVFKFIPFLIENIIHNFTLPGFVFIILGFIFSIRERKHIFFNLLSTSILFQMILMPRKVMGHNHYLLPFFLAISYYFPVLIKKIIDNRKLVNLLRKYLLVTAIFITPLLALYVFTNTVKSEEYKKTYDYIDPIARRAAMLTPKDSKFLFVADKIESAWNIHLNYATGRMGWAFNTDLDSISSLSNAINDKRISFVMLFMIEKGRNRQDILKFRFIHWLFSKYQLLDSFKDVYYLFDVTEDNDTRLDRTGDRKIEMVFLPCLKLSDIRFKKIENENNEDRFIELFWKTGIIQEKQAFFLIMLNPKQDSSIMTHKIMSNSYPTTLWRNKKTYSEVLRIKKEEYDNLAEPLYLYPVLFSPKNNSAFLPSFPGGTGDSILKIDIKNESIELSNISRDRIKEPILTSFESYIKSQQFQTYIRKSYHSCIKELEDEEARAIIELHLENIIENK